MIVSHQHWKNWNSLRSGDCMHLVSTYETFSPISTTTFIPLTCCPKHKENDGQEFGLCKEETRCREMICLCSKTIRCYDSLSNKLKFSSKCLDKITLGDGGDGPMSKYRNVLKEDVKVTSRFRGFRTIQNLLPRTSKQRRGCQTFISRQIYNKLKYALLLLIYNYKQNKVSILVGDKNYLLLLSLLISKYVY